MLGSRLFRIHTRVLRTFGVLSNALTLAVVLIFSSSAQAQYKLRVDHDVMKELTGMFAPFAKISSQQYFQLKNSRNAQLIEAQAFLYQYLSSTEDILSPAPNRSNHYQEVEQMNARPQLFENPVMMQTALEVISREFSKGDHGDNYTGPTANCPLVVKAIRLMGDGVGKSLPGMDPEGNMLVLMQMYYGYNVNENFFMLPCQRELEISGVEGQVQGYRDLETRRALEKLVSFYSRTGEFQFDYSREYIKGLFGNSKGKQTNFSTNATLGNTSLRVTIVHRNVRNSEQFLLSCAQFDNLAQSKRVGTSLDVIRRYTELARPYAGE